MVIEAAVGAAEVRTLVEGSCQIQRKTSTVAGAVESASEKRSWRLCLMCSQAVPDSTLAPRGPATIVTMVDDPERLPDASGPARAEVSVAMADPAWHGTAPWRSSAQGWELGPIRMPGRLLHRADDLWLHLAALELPEPEQHIELAPVGIGPYIEGRRSLLA